MRLKVCLKFTICFFLCVFGFGRNFGLQKKEKTFLTHYMREITGANADKLKGGMYSINYQRTLLLFSFELDFTCVASSWDSSGYHYHKNAYPRKTYKNFIIHVSSVILNLTQLEVSSCLLTA